MPASPALRHISRGTTPSFSHCAWFGAISSSMKRCTVRRNISCSGLNSSLLITIGSLARQYDFGRSSTFSAMNDMMSCSVIGAMRVTVTSRSNRSTWYSFA